ncbi:TRAP transporter small permease [Neobacillus niacini]|uniref:TRAP transporter small permease n=1 Tax=Neobacillus niacini TaxID=86668 RepID=UPI0021CB23D0|nr:TRAP transporter small permease [Neobacillus niacini]MCM3766182.1 TRAP transporter small permease [Neobacillus niacini]
MKGFGLAQKIFERISFCCSVLSTVIIIVMMFAVVLDVIMRWLKTPIYGVFELQGVLVGMTIYLGLSKAQKDKQHIAVNILGQYLPNPIVHFISMLVYAASLVFFGWITYLYGGKAYESYVNGEVIAGITKIPIFPLKLVMTLGLGLLTIQLFFDLVKEIKAIFSKPDNGSTNPMKNEKPEVPEV